jgi:antitoxin HicB
MSSIAYRCRLEPDEDGGFVVTFPDLPFGATQGESVSDSLLEATDCLESILATLVSEGIDIPPPSPIQPGEHIVLPSAVTAAQVALYIAMRRSKVSAQDLSQRLGLPLEEVGALTDLATYPPLERIELALAALGHRLTVALEAAE